MNKTQEALKLALEALDVATTTGARDRQEVLRAYGAIHEALAEQPAQQPYDTHAAPGQSFDTHGRTPPAQQQEPVNKYCCHLCFNKSGQMFLDRMILCPECGNKRCPKATYHELPCTNSNEPGQQGSIYTSPPASKPLTDTQIDLMTDHIYHRGKPVDRDYRICLFRQAEAAHGITGEQK